MAIKNVEINEKTNVGYDQLHPKSSANLIDYNNITSDLTAVNTQEAIDELSKTKGDCDILVFTNKTVVTRDWIADATFADFPFKADIICAGVTTDYIPSVVFNPPYNISGNDSGIADSFNGFIRIYSTEIPASEIIIPTIKCVKKVI